MNDTMPLGLGIFLVGLFTGLIILCWVLLVRMPRWTRPDIYFAVTVTPAFRDTPEAKAIEGRYRRRVAVHSAIALLLVLVTLTLFHRPGLAVVMQVSGLLWQSAWIIVIIALARRETLPYATAAIGVRAASLEPRRMTLAGGWTWALPVAVLLGCAAYLGLRWEDIPERFPTHWGPSGRPDEWSDRGLASVMLPILIGLVTWTTMFAIAAAVPRFSRRRAAGGPSREREQRFMRFGQWALLAFACWIALFTGALSLLPLSLGMNDPLPAWFFIAIGAELVIVGLIVFFAVRFRSGRPNDSDVVAAKTAQPPEGDGTPDSAWKLGLFYYNPDDPALLVEKRFGIGWDLNWGRPAAWLVIAMLMLPGILIPVVVLIASNSNHEKPPAPSTAAVERVVAAPKLMETSPRHGAEGVSPEFAEIRIRFDQAMDPDRGSLTAGGGSFPEVRGERRWEDERTLILPVRLKPATMYEVMIGVTEPFRNKSGQLAPSSVIDFSTAPD